MMKILYLTEEAFNRVKNFLNACQYDWTYTDKGDHQYLVTIFF